MEEEKVEVEEVGDHAISIQNACMGNAHTLYTTKTYNIVLSFVQFEESSIYAAEEGTRAKIKMSALVPLALGRPPFSPSDSQTQTFRLSDNLTHEYSVPSKTTGPSGSRVGAQQR
jgi:hypothetical protein